MPTVRYTHRALLDLASIGEYIAKENPQSAKNVLRSIRTTCQEIAHTPKIGREREEFGAGIRSFPVGNHLIFYRPANSGMSDYGIIVIRVLHGARNLPSAFGEEAP